eukprot:149394-Ditylum_brightwellii.AAC.3
MQVIPLFSSFWVESVLVLITPASPQVIKALAYPVSAPCQCSTLVDCLPSSLTTTSQSSMVAQLQ